MTDGLTLIATLHRAAQIADASFADAMDGGDITTRQMQVLAAIAGVDQPDQTRICQLTGIDRSTLSIICRRLAQKRWIARRHSRRDARAYAMTITPAGRAVLACALAAADRAASRICASIAGVDQLRVIERAQDAPKRARVKPARAAFVDKTGARLPRQLEVLAAVTASEGLCQRDLCDMLDLDRSMISVICTRLAENGWITRRRTAADARAYTMAATAKGRAVLTSAGVVAGRSMVHNGSNSIRTTAAAAGMPSRSP